MKNRFLKILLIAGIILVVIIAAGAIFFILPTGFFSRRNRSHWIKILPFSWEEVEIPVF